jgi:hypothetical protein
MVHVDADLSLPVTDATAHPTWVPDGHFFATSAHCLFIRVLASQLASVQDFKQLLSERVCMVSHVPQGTKTHTLQSFTEQFGFEPCFFPDFQALAGPSYSL